MCSLSQVLNTIGVIIDSYVMFNLYSRFMYENYSNFYLCTCVYCVFGYLINV